jgi:hypothetical protein
MISEIVDDGSSSNKFYDLGNPININYKDENGDTKKGMVILCPRCGGSGNNTSRTLNRLHGTHITQQQADRFGGGCYTNRKDAKCVGGLMMDKKSGRIIWPHSDSINKKESEDSGPLYTIEQLKSEYPDEYMMFATLYNKHKNDDQSFTGKRIHAMVDSLRTTGSISQKSIDLLRNKIREDELKQKHIKNPKLKHVKSKENRPENATRDDRTVGSTLKYSINPQGMK